MIKIWRKMKKAMTSLKAICKRRIVIQNKHGEKLVGVLHQVQSKNLMILCHGFQATKDDSILVSIADALVKEEICAFRFDFAGNGESEGVFRYGHYHREADDLRAVVSYFSNQTYNIIAIVGHSKGGNAALLYASEYHDIPSVVNISGRFGLNHGIQGRLGKGFMERITKDGFIDVKDKLGNFEYRVTLDSLMDRLNTDMHEASCSIPKEIRVLTIHGSRDQIVPVKDAFEFAKLIPNHKLHVIEGANHRYTEDIENLIVLVLQFIRESQILSPTGENDKLMSKL
ncbi:alpha/beta-Hydrolases superfamily protein [Rhynchospora pubera]|uniref:Alpha/beta-Hydrolases superfamily protein n=1 Tax=Rhynchospora pubera TaxID=906938 RepID=A0AAV8ELU8_9POAL|nr:alpha/beta-Hydrolases superfamily protein [Rhynchospora pubera]KAJ4780495.1 alpha/beta-Hydrolases superfamily protein [Rhynchospora pubera]